MTDPSPGRLTVDGSALHYEKHGAGPLVVLVTGLAGVLDWWRPAIPLLAASHNVVAHDLRGCGRSADAGDVSMAAQARDVLALADACGVDRFTVVGASFGGCVVQELLCTAPERLTAAVLLCSGPADLHQELMSTLLDPGSALARARQAAGVDDSSPMPDRLLADAPLLFTEEFTTTRRYQRWLADVPAAHSAHVGPEPSAYLMAAATHNRYADLHRGTTPVLAVMGTEDVFIPSWVQQRDAAEIPGAISVTVAGGRHGLPVERAELWVALTEDLRAGRLSP